MKVVRYLSLLLKYCDISFLENCFMNIDLRVDNGCMIIKGMNYFSTIVFVLWSLRAGFYHMVFSGYFYLLSDLFRHIAHKLKTLILKTKKKNISE